MSFSFCYNLYAFCLLEMEVIGSRIEVNSACSVTRIISIALATPIYSIIKGYFVLLYFKHLY